MSKTVRRALACVVLMLGLCGSSPIRAQDQASSDERALQSIDSRLTGAEAQLGAGDLPISVLERIRDGLTAAVRDIADLRASAHAQAERLALSATEVRADVAPCLASFLAGRRAALARAQAVEADLAAEDARADELVRTVGVREAAAVREALRTTVASPLSPATWSRAAASVAAVAVATTRASAFQVEILTHPPIPASAGAVLLLAVAVSVRRMRVRRSSTDPAVSRSAKLAAAMVVIGPSLICLSAALLTASSTSQPLSGVQDLPLIGRVIRGAVAFMLVRVVADALLAPRAPAWSLLMLPADVASRIHRLVVIIGVLAWIGAVIASDPRQAPDLASVSVFLVSLATALAGLALQQPCIWRAVPLGRGARGAARSVLILAFASPLALAATGHAAWAQEALARLVALGLLLSMLFPLRESAFLLLRRVRPPALTVALGVLVDVVLFGYSLYVLLIAVNVPAPVIQYWVLRGFAGFEVGGFKLSLRGFARALVALTAVLVTFRLLHNLLGARMRPESGVDLGLRDAFLSTFRYVGVGTAILMATIAMGFSLSSIAIVVSALSVGAGFALRPALENFVAGLILLLERPIRAGDWVVIGNAQGVVRQISARSTKIETFERAMLVVPNVTIINETVTNWTLSDRIARIDVAIHVPAALAPAQVISELVAVAVANSRILAEPAPSAILSAFGENTLGYRLLCFVAEGGEGWIVKSELSSALVERFRELGIDTGLGPERGWIPT